MPQATTIEGVSFLNSLRVCFCSPGMRLDPQGMLLFSGSVETKEDLDKVPADVRQRYEKLQLRDLPGVISFDGADEEGGSADG